MLRKSRASHIGPTRSESLLYAPLDRATFDPDVVVFRETPGRSCCYRRRRARQEPLREELPWGGRPARCFPGHLMPRPASQALRASATRVYTELGDNELYLAAPGHALQATLKRLETILNANVALEAFHRERAERLGAS